jgi:very-short-patch-repair endonuclease
MKNDLYKMRCANNNGFSIIRVLQKDVYKNQYDWLSEIKENIEKITLEKRVQNIYMCKNNEYKDFDII